MAKLIRSSTQTGRILLVDDEVMVRKAIRLILAFGGFHVVEAEDGEDAVQKYRDASPPFDLVLIDMDMPRMSGVEALAQIRKFDPNARAILLSGGFPGHTLEKTNFLQKPFENQQLIGLVRETLAAP